MRTGSNYRSSLADGRHVVIDGGVVRDVASHAAFRGAVDTIAGLYDHAADSASGMTCVAPETGVTVNRVYTTPRSREDLASWREAIANWARLSRVS
jgi:4-hydroxyphenylacetate 3-monooxygenase